MTIQLPYSGYGGPGTGHTIARDDSAGYPARMQNVSDPQNAGEHNAVYSQDEIDNCCGIRACCGHAKYT